MADTDQNLCPHCGQPMPETAEENLGRPDVEEGKNTAMDESYKVAESTLVDIPGINELEKLEVKEDAEDDAVLLEEDDKHTDT
jgi:hypothetical protein|tara:strand:- start:67 stop:315 length:249 start_codon:yes stop_codon:yes gene_type:complete